MSSELVKREGMKNFEGKWVVCELTQWSRDLLEHLIKSESDFTFEGVDHNGRAIPKFLIVPYYTSAEIFAFSYVIMKNLGKDFRLLLPESILKSPTALFVTQRGLKVIDTENEIQESLYAVLSSNAIVVCFPEKGFVPEKKFFEIYLGLSSLDFVLEAILQDFTNIKSSLENGKVSSTADGVHQSSWFLLGLNYLPSRFGRNPFESICDVYYEELASGYLNRIETKDTFLGNQSFLEVKAFHLNSLDTETFKEVSLKLQDCFTPNLERMLLFLLNSLFPLTYTEREIRNKFLYLLNQLEGRYDLKSLKMITQWASSFSCGENIPQWRHLLSFLEEIGMLRLVKDRTYKVRVKKKDEVFFGGKRYEYIQKPFTNSGLNTNRTLSKKERFFIKMTPHFIVSHTLANGYYKKDIQIFEEDYTNNFHAEWTKDAEVGRPFFWRVPGSKIGVLLSHGYLSAPMEVRALGEFLYKSGISVYGIRLKGHGTSPLDLANSKWEEWYESLNRGLSALRCLYDKVYLCGFSAGGCLVLYASSRKNVEDISGVISISAPIKLQNYAINLLPTVTTLNYVLKKFGSEGWDLLDHKPENPHINYQKNPLSGLRQLKTLMEETEKILPLVKIPTLIIQGSHDNTVNPESANIIFEQLGSEKKYKIVFHRRNHGIINGDLSREIFVKIREFILNDGF